MQVVRKSVQNSFFEDDFLVCYMNKKNGMLSRRKDSLNCKRNKPGILDKRAVMSFGKLFSDRVSYVNIVFRNLNECVFIFGLSTFQNYRLVFDLSHPSLAVTFIPQRDIQLTRLMST